LWAIGEEILCVRNAKIQVRVLFLSISFTHVKIQYRFSQLSVFCFSLPEKFASRITIMAGERGNNTTIESDIDLGTLEADLISSCS
jgi:hypothetical protein